MMREPAFDELRTKQQLGYVVFVTRWDPNGSIGLRFLLQSEREPVYLESRVDAFLEAYKLQLAATPSRSLRSREKGSYLRSLKS